MHKVVVAFLLVFGAVPRVASGQAPVGSEFRVNAYTTAAQTEAAVAVRPDGSFVVVWSSDLQDGSSFGVFARRYDAAGMPGSETQVNSYVTSTQRGPAVAATTGGFVVVWHSYQQDGSGNGVFGQLYDTSFTPQGPEFRVNSTTTGYQDLPAVAATAGGGFVVAFRSGSGALADVFAQRYDAGGSPQGAQFRVNSYTTSAQTFPEIASDAAGNFVVAWSSFAQDGHFNGVFAQRFSAGAMPQGAEFAVNTYTTNTQNSSSVSMDAAGNFVVAWTSAYEDGSATGAFGRRYNASGVPTPPFRVSVSTLSTQSGPAVAMDGGGGFVAVWTGAGSDSVFGRVFDAGATPITGEFVINSYTTSSQYSPAIAAGPGDTFVVVWESRNQDGDQTGIFGQRIGGSDLIFLDGFETP